MDKKKELLMSPCVQARPDLAPMITNTFPKDFPIDVLSAMIDVVCETEGHNARAVMHWLKDMYDRNVWKEGDKPETIDAVKAFYAVPRNRNISTFDNVAELFRYVDENKAVEAAADGEDHIVLYDDGRWFLVIPKTERAAYKYGRGTRWCTATEDPSKSMFDYYSRDGELLILIDKENDRKWQVSFSMNQLMDAEDHHAKWEELELPEAAYDVICNHFVLPQKFYEYSETPVSLADGYWVVGEGVINKAGKFRGWLKGGFLVDGVSKKHYYEVGDGDKKEWVYVTRENLYDYIRPMQEIIDKLKGYGAEIPEKYYEALEEE